MLQAVDRAEWVETIEIYNENVLDVSMTEGDEDHILAVTQEVHKLHIMMFY